MLKIFVSIISAILLFLFSLSSAQAQFYPYVIENFHSDININQDSSITVKETIKVNFNEERHGIFRYIPVVYHTPDQTINSRLDIISITDQNGKGINYDTSSEGNNIELKIGDGDKLITGPHTYVISYRVRNVLQRFPDHDELYWDVAGNGWDTEIASMSAQVTSNFANITQLTCYAGSLDTTEQNCNYTNNSSHALFVSDIPLGNGEDMTIVVGLDKNNQLVWEGSLKDKISDNWGYALPFLPLLILMFAWITRGRDERYISDNVYYDPKNKSTETLPLVFKREYLPMVYSPINGLTPSEVGSILDESVDIEDIVAEITELGRMGYLKIEKINKKFAKDDFLITKLKDSDRKLRDYQKYLHDSLFSYANEKGEVKLSELKRKFYTKLNSFKEKLYKHMDQQKYFMDRPDHAKAKWVIIAALLLFASFYGFIWFMENTFASPAGMLLYVFAIPTIILALSMPRRSPKGYAYKRQIEGLKFYLGKGQWRQKINEKHLFLEEMLPLAISLGVVSQLAKDMEELGVNPPSYFNAPVSAWAGSVGSFNSAASSSFSTGSSSGGSGFSGGGGGGFGGGGGGSW